MCVSKDLLRRVVILSSTWMCMSKDLLCGVVILSSTWMCVSKDLLLGTDAFHEWILQCVCAVRSLSMLR